MTSIRSGFMGMMMAAALSGCMLGPQYQRPAAPTDQTYDQGAQPSQTAATTGQAGAAQTFVYQNDLPAQWWQLFQQPALDQLVQEALAHNYTVVSAQQTLQQAQAQLRVAQSVFYPQVSANGEAGRVHAPLSTPPGAKDLYTLYTGDLQVSYAPDFFGLNRLVAQEARAQLDLRRYELAAAQLTLTGNVVATAIRAATLQAQIDASNDIVKAQQDLLALVQARYQRGSDSYLNVVAQQSQLASSEALLPPLQAQLAAAQHALAVLLGKTPAQLQAPDLRLDALTLPQTIPVALPSKLVEHRPDISAAEAQLRAANAAVGVAVAEQFPQFSLTGAYGRGRHDAGDVTVFGTPWNALLDMTVPIFEGGRLRAQKKAAQAQYRAFLADYQQTVLDAFRQVADALRNLDADARSLNARQRSLQAAMEALGLAKAQYEAGATDYLNLLQAQVQYAQSQLQYVQAQAQRYADTNALFVALGGGWWQMAPSAQPAHS